MTTIAARAPLPTLRIARSVAVLAVGLLAGAVLLVWAVDVPLGRSAELYQQYRQATTGLLTALLPPLGAVGLVAALLAAALDRGVGRALAAGAGALLLVGLVLTVGVLFPINDAVLAWTAPPPDWTVVRDRWRAAHAVRSVATVAAFVLLVAADRVPRWGRSAAPSA
jgi:hypothetical protein